MTAQPTDPAHVPDTGSYEVIHLGDQAAVVVPVADFLRLRALERHASPEALEEADMESAFAEYREWAAEGRPGAISHEEMAAELLGEPSEG